MTILEISDLLSPEPAHEDEPGAGARAAVAESRWLLATSWTSWCVDHGVDPVHQPVAEEPVVYEVGSAPDELEWVALIRFAATVDGTRLRGLVRGPVDDAVFSVRRLEAVTETAPKRLGWRRRRP